MAMNDGSGDCNIRSSFRSCRIVWLIENYCLAIRDEPYTISSPEFTMNGNDSTKWRLMLEVKKYRNEDDKVSFFLERLRSREPDSIVVDFEGTVFTGVKQYTQFEFKHTFAENSKKEHCLSGSSVIAEFEPFEPDTLKIICNFIACYSEGVGLPPKQYACGLKLLSQDLYESRDKNTDIILKVDGREIKAHKAILSRNKVLQEYIKKAKDDEIQLKEFDYDAVSKFVNFLYSGDINYVISEPTIRMAKCMEHFSSDLLKYYYASEELNMRSIINTDAHEFRWVISEIHDEIFEKEEFAISSPSFKRLNVDTTWKLNMSLNLDEVSGKSISLFAVIVEGDRPPYFCMEFGIENEKKETFCGKRILRYNRCYDNMGFKDFVQVKNLKGSPLLTDDALRIRFRVRTFDGSQRSFMGCRSMSFVTLAEEPSYQLLSSEMAELLKKENYSDITLKCEDKEFKAHKFVLIARSGYFSRKIKDMSSDTDSFPLEDVQPNLFAVILDYIYSGVLKDHQNSELIELYNVSKRLDILCLKDECHRLLKERGIDINFIQQE